MGVAAALVGKLAGEGITLFVDQGRLRFRAPRGVFTDEVRALVAAHREEVIAYLEGREEQTTATPQGACSPSTSPATPGGAAGPTTDATEPAVDPESSLPISAAAVYGRVEEALAAGRRRFGRHNARLVVLEAFATLAGRWFQAGDPKLLEVEGAVRELLGRWEEEDGAAVPAVEVPQGRRDLPPGWW